MNFKKLSYVAIFVMLIGVAGIPTARAQAINGAIYTSTSTGETVNGNIYDSKDAVYLNGGPTNSNCGAGALPAGNYVFQVTNPSGSDLLSEDDISQRTFTVAGGVITNAFSHATSPNQTTCGGIAVQLIPYLDTPNNGGEYKVWVTRASDYSPGNGAFGFVPGNIKTDNFKVRQSDPEVHEASIVGAKFYDANADGIWNNGEVGIQNWMITRTPPTGGDVTFTNINGYYSYLINSDIDFGDYTISEGTALETNWYHTNAASGVVTVAEGATGEIAGPVFGNLCTVPGSGGLTLGFWSNKNGQALETAADFAALTTLHLRNANGSDRDFVAALNPNRTTLNSWLLNANANNMAYMLSAQLTATTLNTRHGLSGGTIVLLTDGTFMTINNLMAAAETELTLHPVTVAAGPDRTRQEFLKTNLDRINNNLLRFVSATPCAFSFAP